MLKLYKTLDSGNVINKTLTHLIDFNIKFKDSFSISSPTINLRIKDDFNMGDVNYAYITDFNRYYFVTDIQMLSDDVYKLYLDVDVLESFKDDILNSYGEISKSVEQGDYSQINTNIDVRKDIDIYDSDKSLDGTKYIILSTIGG